MNKLFFSTLLLSAAGSYAVAQKMPSSRVPVEVRAAFGKAHPGTGKVNWEREDGAFEAAFTAGDQNISELYTKQGLLIESETDISISALPPAIKDYVKAHYAGEKIKEAAKITSSKGTVTYEAAVKGKDLIFDDNGNFMKVVKD
jgi:hypothetical protein